MPHSTNKELILGIMVGTTGISLLLLWYHKICKPRTAMNLPKFLSLGNTVDSMTLQDEMHNGQGAAAIFQGRQLQILEKLNELLTNVEELKSEIRILKEAMPKLEEYIHGELGGKTTVHKISPQHRARKRRLATVQSSGTSNSSEEAESEGGCRKEYRSFPPNGPAAEVTSDPLLHCGASSITHPCTSLDLKSSYDTMCRVSFHGDSSYRGSKHLSSPSNTSTYSSFSGIRCPLLAKFQKSSASIHHQQSRANFDSQEKISSGDLKSSSDHFDFKCQRLFSAGKLSIISCYESGTFFDLQLSSENILNPNETEIISKKSHVTDAEKYVSSSPDYGKYFMNFETRANSSALGNSIDRSTYQQHASTYSSISSHFSSSHQENGIATDIQERNQLKEDSLHPDSHSHSTDHSPAMTQQHLSKSVTSVLHHVGFSLFTKDARNFTPFQSEVTADYHEDENIGNSSQDEDESSPMEIPKIRYITANTDTEDQSFPAPVALNTHVEELNLDALLQKVDNLRTNESSKTESFELLCDYKEKFRDEIEFIWRFARAYGDMYELSTNTQEKKHYANIGKTLGEKAITRAPMNGHCHLWYAVLCGCVSEFEGLQNKINYGYRFKEHLDKAIQFLPEEPFLYYLKGRYCYTVSKLSWIEKKMAATLFKKIPSSTVQEALQNFLKVEELHPGFSKSNYMFLAKCYMDLQQVNNAVKFCHLAMLLPCVTKEDKDAQKEVKKISTFLKS